MKWIQEAGFCTVSTSMRISVPLKKMKHPGRGVTVLFSSDWLALFTRPYVSVVLSLEVTWLETGFSSCFGDISTSSLDLVTAWVRFRGICNRWKAEKLWSGYMWWVFSIFCTCISCHVYWDDKPSNIDLDLVMRIVTSQDLGSLIRWNSVMKWKFVWENWWLLF